MKRVLITGMSGTGKSAVARKLAARKVRRRTEAGSKRGHQAIDLDTLEWSEWIAVDPADTLAPGDGKDWVWREERVRAPLSRHHRGILFVCGCAENMGRLFPWIDTVILLSAPVDTIMKRPVARSSDGYGSTGDERRKVVELIATIEPLLRQSADHEIDTSGSVGSTADEILRLT